MNANNESNLSKKRPSTVEKKIKGPTKEQLKEEVKLLRKEIKSLKEKIEWQTIPQQKNKTQEKYLFRKKGNENILAEVGSGDLVSFILDYHSANLEHDFFSKYEIKINDNWETITDSFFCDDDGFLIVEDIGKNNFIIKVRFFSNHNASKFMVKVYEKNDTYSRIDFESDSKEPGIRRAMNFINEKIALEEEARKAKEKAQEEARKAQEEARKAQEKAQEEARKAQEKAQEEARKSKEKAQEEARKAKEKAQEEARKENQKIQEYTEKRRKEGIKHREETGISQAYRLSINGKVIGEFPKAEIMDGLKNGRVLLTNHVWQPGWISWKLISEIEELIPNEVKKRIEEEKRKLQEEKDKAEEGGFWSWFFGAPKCHNCGKRTKVGNITGRKWLGSATTRDCNGNYRPADMIARYYHCEFCGHETGIASKDEV